MVVTNNLSFLIASSWGFSSLNSTSFFSRVRKGQVTSTRFGMNFPTYVIMPKNHWSSLTEFDNDIFVIASIFAGSTFTHSDDIICPRNTTDFTPIWHFFLFRFSPLLRIFKNNLFKCSLCLERVLLHTIISSWELALPGTSEIIQVISHWKTLLAEWIP